MGLCKDEREMRMNKLLNGVNENMLGLELRPVGESIEKLLVLLLNGHGLD